MDFPFSIIYRATMQLLPAHLDSSEAAVALFAIGMQESDGFRARRQYNDGPARGFWQFEQGGAVRGVLNHPATKVIARSLLDRLQYDDYPANVWNALEHNDILAMGFARLNLLWLPKPLPKLGAEQEAWGQYLEAWRPGKPHPAKWPANYQAAINYHRGVS